MSAETAWIAFQSLVSLCIILWLAFWGFPAYRLARYRQGLFEVRDALFDYAAEGKIPFDHPAYGMLRSTINGFIRFGHRLSFSHIVLMAALDSQRSAQSEYSFSNRWATNTEGLPSEVKARLDSLLVRVSFHTGRYMLGYLADLLLSITRSIYAAASFGGRIKQFLREVRDDTYTTALVYGCEDAQTSGVDLAAASV